MTFDAPEPITLSAPEPMTLSTPEPMTLSAPVAVGDRPVMLLLRVGILSLPTVMMCGDLTATSDLS